MGLIASWAPASGNWLWVPLVYASYLAAVSFTRREFARARVPLSIAAAAAAALFVVGSRAPLGPAMSVVVPSLVLLAGYWLSGLLFVRPDVDLERRLTEVDDRLLRRTGILDAYQGSPRAVREFFELSYLLVYPTVPAGAATLLALGHAADVDRFWTLVLVAEFACYGMLPWLQTRPPRVLESTEGPGDTAVRRLNLLITGRASIQVNTVPSGHAAGAFATAFALMPVQIEAGIAFLAIAVSISLATVLGRYHYAVDTVLGFAVALGAWLLTSAVG